MKRFFYLIAMALGIYPMHAQDIQKSEDTNPDSTLVKNHWSDKSTESYTLLKREFRNTIGPQTQPTEATGNSMDQCTSTNRLSSQDLSEITVYEPKGNYKMRVFEVDSTQQFHLKIYKAL